MLPAVENRSRANAFSDRMDYPIDKELRQINKLEHVLVEKVDQLFRDTPQFKNRVFSQCGTDGRGLTNPTREEELAMARKMHAAVVEKFGKPLVFQEWDIPTPGSGQILVKSEACGVCHTDLHAAHGDWPLKPTLPFIPGHEGIGLVAAVG